VPRREKKHKEKKHKEKKHQPDSERKRERKDKKQQQQQQPPAAPAAAAAAVAVPSGSSVPSPALPFDGLGLQQLQFSCPLDFAAAKAGQDEEVWVLRLPAGVSEQLPGTLRSSKNTNMLAAVSFCCYSSSSSS
jgi:outer membrane biosynthesis protein TonB